MREKKKEEGKKTGKQKTFNSSSACPAEVIIKSAMKMKR